ncbi:class I glutamine amidotransferase-like protein [Schizopora paradoxa]|uniref:Class I glutamine amidotransferase-like protein n=1 Tax=Schizopora paradoxa TaxID=27342 RepID=A0A0H2RYQ1_9AGAM|nr:class I glutamine amidotransferase-like protein [Schizopora paradoxa]
MSLPEAWNVAICLFNNVTALDFQGPIELFGFLSPASLERRGSSLFDPKIALNLHYLSTTLDPITPISGPKMNPTDVYSSTKQYDILLIPGGPGARPGVVPDELLAFIKKQAPGAQYILSVCTGSWILAGTGLLDGKRATTNKAAFARCKEATSDSIQWVPKARWVVDGNIWTSSGVTAGMDMANAFLTHVYGEKTTKQIRNIIELSAKEETDDEFAHEHGLV